MRRFLLTISSSRIVALFAVMMLPTASTPQTITTFDVPNSGSTAAQAINLRGQVTGYYEPQQGKTGAFIRERDGTITTFNVQLFNLFWLTWGTDINVRGEVIGYVSVPAGGDFGFIREKDGTVVTFPNRDTSIASAAFAEPAPLRDCLDGTAALAVNEIGEITGTVGGNCDHGFLRYRDGTIVSFWVAVSPSSPNAMTIPKSINIDRQITGYYFDPQKDSYFHGFLRGRHGRLTMFDVPNAIETRPKAINAIGKIAGSYEDVNLVLHGFLRRPDGKFITFDPPGSVSTQVSAINIIGEITGFYATAGGMYHGFLRKLNGAIESFDAPDAANAGTFPKDISDLGEITGYYQDTSFAVHSFVRTRR